MTRPAIIDLRCRMPSGAGGGYFAARHGAESAAPFLGAAPERFFSELDAAGVGTAVAVGYNNEGLRLGRLEMPPRRTDNDEQARLQREHAGRFLGVAGIDVSGTLHDPVEELERCVRELGLRLAGIEPGRAPLFAEHPADRRLYRFYERAQELGVPVMLQTSGYYGGRDLDYANPRWIDRLADDFPELPIVCGHACYPYVREMIAVAVRRANVYPSPDLYVFAPARREWVYAVNRRVITDKFLFGSGFPLCGSLARTVSRFLLLGWRPGVLDRILYRNALAALRLDSDPAFAALADGPDRFGPGSIVRAGLRLVLHEARSRVRRAARAKT